MDLDLKTIQRWFSPKDYARGLDYVRHGRVQDMKCSNVDGHTLVTCTVEGNDDYQVHFQDYDDNYYRISCTCPRFDDMGRCKHVAAAMIAYVKDSRKEVSSQSDYYAQALLKRYLDKSKQKSDMPEVSARLVPVMDIKNQYQDDYPAFSFRVGREKLYVVKNIRDFLSNVDHRNTVAYGKGLTLDHSIENFDPRSQEMITLMMNEYGEFRSMRYSSLSYGYAPPNYLKNEITFTGDSFDRWFAFLSDQPVETNGGKSVTFAQGDPKISIHLEKKDKNALLEIKTPFPCQFFGSCRSLYAFCGETLLQCSSSFRDKVYPMLAQRKNTLQLSLQDLPTFCSCVLPEIEEYVEVDDPGHLLQDYMPEECMVCFYFDMDGDTLSLKLAFRYGTREITLSDKPSHTDSIRRDIKTESSATALAQRYFQPKGSQFTLEGEDASYDFLTQSLDAFRNMGEVYFSDRLNRRRIQPSPASVGLSVSDGLLTLDLDTGGFPPEELSALYQSLLLRKKYHRLADGRYLELNGSSCEKLAEMTQMLQLSKRDLSHDTITLPAYRGLYLDTLLSDKEGIQVRRDSQFRSMIRNFKAVSEGDYALPGNLESVLRPYQKVGFQWLKTLESYGFGGILADEMGLGKTLQVIAFLSTVPKETVGHPSLVICPASLIYNWGEELQKFAPQLSARLILGNAAERKALRADSGDADVWVTSYELLRQDIAEYEALDFYCCILDEAQHIKNSSTLASKAVKRISCRQRFVLTGTPVENRLSELWNLFDFLMSGYLFSNTAFREKLEKPIVKSKNPEASTQLRRLVQPFMLRRLKKDVLKELPPKEEHIRRIALSEEEQKAYYSCVHAIKENLGEDQGKLQILAALTRLRQICCDPNLCFENYEGSTSKLDACIELCEAMVENGHQILLFSQFTSMLDRIRARLDELQISSFTLQGSTPKETRAKLVKAFHAGEASVFLISLKAGGTGLNLTAADVVIHYDPWWNQAAQDQATDRAHRIGQQAHVQVYKLITKDTIEEKILELQDKKAALMDTISGAEESGILSMSKEDLLALLETR